MVTTEDFGGFLKLGVPSWGSPKLGLYYSGVYIGVPLFWETTILGEFKKGRATAGLVAKRFQRRWQGIKLARSAELLSIPRVYYNLTCQTLYLLGKKFGLRVCCVPSGRLASAA